ncbi:MAG: hypothetical protein ACFFD1_15190, partial [Candidatus Thorarchaeota archaeon]
RDIITDIKFTPDNKFLISGSEDKSIKIWDYISGTIVRTILETTNFAENIYILKTKSHLISGGRDSILRIWDYTTGKQIGKLKGHFDEIRSIITPADEKTVISGSDDGTIRLFNLENNSQEQVFEGHTGFVTSCSVISGYDSSKEKDTTDIQEKMLEGNFPDYYTYSRAEKKGILTFDEYIISSKVKSSSKRRAKSKPKPEKDYVDISEVDIDNELINIINSIKTYKTLGGIEKEIKKVLKNSSASIPPDLIDLLIQKIDLLEKHSLIEIGTRGKSKTVKKIDIIEKMPS